MSSAAFCRIDGAHGETCDAMTCGTSIADLKVKAGGIKDEKLTDVSRNDLNNILFGTD